MSLEHSPTRRRGPSPFSVADPSLTINEFCAAEKVSRALLYNLWKRGKGPRYFYAGNSRRISHEARQQWRREREAEAVDARSACAAESTETSASVGRFDQAEQAHPERTQPAGSAIHLEGETDAAEMIRAGLRERCTATTRVIKGSSHFSCPSDKSEAD
jgi:hypothetical protein